MSGAPDSSLLRAFEGARGYVAVVVEGKQTAMWILQSAAPDSEPLTFRISAGAIKTVGRAPRADFIVDAALVSRLHCRLTATDAQLEVEDLKSTNGTFVNDKRIERATLANGDRLRVGRFELRVELRSSSGTGSSGAPDRSS